LDQVLPRVQKRGAEVIGALGASSALSAAQAVRKHVAGLLLGDARGNPAADATTAEGDSFSMACMLPKNTRVADDGSDVGAAVMPADLVFSVPYRFDSATGVVRPIIWPVPASALADTTQELLEEAWTARRIVEDMEIRIRDDCGLCNVPSPAARL
jgi:malate/lactate dehydrogenase